MKIKNLFMTLGLAFAAVGVAAGMFANGHQEVKEAKAEAAASDTTIYLDSSAVDWWAGGETPANLYVWMCDSTDSGSNPSKWVSLHYEGTNHYSFKFKATYTKMVFVRSGNSELDGTSTGWGGSGNANIYNQTVDVNFDSTKNCVKILGSTSGSNQEVEQKNINDYQNPIAKDDKLYATIDNKDYDWFGAGATTSFFLWNDITGAIKVLSGSCISSTSTTVVGQLDAAFTATGFKVVRVASGKSFDGSDWSNSVVWNEGANVDFTSSYASARCIIDRTRTGQWNYTDAFEVVSASYFAKAFSYYFLEATGNYCNGEGGAEVNPTVQGQLAAALVAFEALQEGTKAELATADLDHKADGWRTDDRRNAPVSEAASKYWHMTHATNHKAGAAYDDFLSLGSTFMLRSATNFEMATGESDNSIALIVALVSITSLLTVGGYFLLRKRED